MNLDPRAPQATPGSTPPTAPSADDVRAALQAAFQPPALEVIDDSHLHAGHAGAREGRHFTVRIRSERFVGLNRVARHRLVYDALAAWMPRGIHALAIDAQAP
jgi:BolA protein